MAKQKIPTVMSPYNAFCKIHRSDIVKQNHGLAFGAITSILAGQWHELDTEGKKKYGIKAQEFYETKLAEYEKMIAASVSSSSSSSSRLNNNDDNTKYIISDDDDDDDDGGDDDDDGQQDENITRATPASKTDKRSVSMDSKNQKAKNSITKSSTTEGDNNNNNNNKRSISKQTAAASKNSINKKTVAATAAAAATASSSTDGRRKNSIQKDKEKEKEKGTFKGKKFDKRKVINWMLDNFDNIDIETIEPNFDRIVFVRISNK